MPGRMRSSRSRRRSTARPSRMLSALMSVPTAVSMKTGATASWMTAAISGMCGSYAKPPVYPGVSASLLCAVGRTGRRRSCRRLGGLLSLLSLLLLLDLLLRALASRSDGGRRADRDCADRQEAGLRCTTLGNVEGVKRGVHAVRLVVALAVDLHAHPRIALLLRPRVEWHRVIEH